MSDDSTSPRRPFGERDDDEKQLPFGARPPVQRPERDALTERDAFTAPPPREPDPEPDDPEPEHVYPASPHFEEVFPTLSRRRAAEEEPVLVNQVEVDEVEVDNADGNWGQPEREFMDEPDDLPGILAVRKQRGRGDSSAALVKQRDVRAALAGQQFKSYPAEEAAEAAEQVAREAAEERAQVALRFREVINAILVMFGTAVLFATLFTWWTPNTFLSAESMDRLSVALATQASGPAPLGFLPTLTPLVQPTAVPTNNIGIVSGHRGINPSSGLPDTGALCEDGLTEQAVVENVAIQVAELLRGHGYSVDLFDEFDPRLQGYTALAMLSIHADSCEYINDVATGFKVASFAESSAPEQDARLVSCMIARYGETTALPFHPSVTFDMTQYHNFGELAPGTPGAILEIGFLYLDRALLTDHADVVALGVARGMLCYLRNEPIDLSATPEAPTSEAPADVTPTRVP